MASTSRAGRPRMRSRLAHLPSCIPVAPKAVKPRTKSAQRTPAKGKGKGAGKGKKTTKKSGKAAAVVSSDSEDLEVDFPCKLDISLKQNLIFLRAKTSFYHFLTWLLLVLQTRRSHVRNW